MESNYGNSLQPLLWLCSAAVVVLIAVAFAILGRLRKIHHCLRNIEHYAKHARLPEHEEWRGAENGASLSDSDD
jgi:hypothetical protein